MILSQKCQYALRAVFELAKRHGQGPTKITDIAKAQAIPTKFLEAILNQMRQAGYLISRRGKAGGYMLAKNPDKMTVADIINVIEGPITIVECAANTPKGICAFDQNCVFLPMWENAKKAIDEIYQKTTFESLVTADKSNSCKKPMYNI